MAAEPGEELVDVFRRLARDHRESLLANDCRTPASAEAFGSGPIRAKLFSAFVAHLEV